jgi:hypothetical protein
MGMCEILLFGGNIWCKIGVWALVWRNPDAKIDRQQLGIAGTGAQVRLWRPAKRASTIHTCRRCGSRLPCGVVDSRPFEVPLNKSQD